MYKMYRLVKPLCILMFLQKRKRKEKEDDTVSLSSFDLKVRVQLSALCRCNVAHFNASSQQTFNPSA